MQRVAIMDDTQINSEGRRVTFKSRLSPKYPAIVIVASAITRAMVPASVESKPPLYVPRESLEDITRESSDKLTPGKVMTWNSRNMTVKLLVVDRIRARAVQL